MCYSGKCKYEYHSGDCSIYGKVIPDDAKDGLCMICETEDQETEDKKCSPFDEFDDSWEEGE